MEKEWKVTTVKEVRKKGKIGTLFEADIEEVTKGLFGCAPRVYWINNGTPVKSYRGGHHHLIDGKQEFLLCLSGEVKVEIHATEERGGCGRIILDSPVKALVIPSMVWHGVEISPHGILLAIASTKYKEGESIEKLKECSCGRFSPV